MGNARHLLAAVGLSAAVVACAPGSGPVLSIQGAAPRADGPTSLKIHHAHTAKVPADVAFVTAFIYSYGPGGPNPGLGAGKDEVKRALEGLGFRGDAVKIESDPEGMSVTVEVPVDQVPTKGQEVLDALEDVLGFAEEKGVMFALKDCAGQLERLRGHALAAVAERAMSLAEASGVTLGSVAAIRERPGDDWSPFGEGDACGSPESALGPYGSGPFNLLPLTAAPETRVSLDLTVTYNTAGGGVGGVTASASGTTTAPADKAYAIAWVAPPYDPRGAPIADSAKRLALLERLSPLGLNRETLRIEESVLDGSYVMVEVPLSRLPKIGEDFVQAVNRTIGRVEEHGLIFAHSACQDILGQARKQAIEDASGRAASLAAAADLKVGGIALIEEFGDSLYGRGAYLDPCRGPADLSMSDSYSYLFSLQPFTADPVFEAGITLEVTLAAE